MLAMSIISDIDPAVIRVKAWMIEMLRGGARWSTSKLTGCEVTIQEDLRSSEPSITIKVRVDPQRMRQIDDMLRGRLNILAYRDPQTVKPET